jgi:hypothetical protein
VKQHTSPGTRSAAFESGREQQATGHTGRFDRNPLLYAMLEIHLSLSGSDEYGRPYRFSTLDMYDFVCGSGSVRGDVVGPAGWRVATPTSDGAGAEQYDVERRRGIEVPDFGPVVAFGSLDALRSMRMAALDDCDATAGLAPEDGVRSLVCEHGAWRSMGLDLADRAFYSPFSMQRDSWCNPNQDIDVEDVVGNPFRFTEDLTDTSDRGRRAQQTHERRKLFFGAIAKFVSKKILRNIPVVGDIISAPLDAIDGVVESIPIVGDVYKAGNDVVDNVMDATVGQIPGVGQMLTGGGRSSRASRETARRDARERAREGVQGSSSQTRTTGRPADPSFLDNMRVPASSRGEENFQGSNGEYRALSLMSWVFVTSSSDPDVRAGMYRLADLPVFRKAACGSFPKVTCSVEDANGGAKVLNENAPLVDGLSSDSDWLSGKRALIETRCSEMVREEFGFSCTQPRPYASFQGCSDIRLELGSRPELYGPLHFLPRLDPRTPGPSPPPPPPTPQPPPSPSPPAPSPSPPHRYDQWEIMERVRRAEERVCSSVYYLSQQTRCDRLAVDLSERVLMSFVSPPVAPPPRPAPAPVTSGMTGSPPPPPPLLQSTEITYVAATSARLSTARLPAEDASAAIDALASGYYVPNSEDLQQKLFATAREQWACTPSAPLACATGILRCLNDARRCGTANENARDPFVDARFVLRPGHYLWAVVIQFPENLQLALLGEGPLSIEIFGPREEPIYCEYGFGEVQGVEQDRSLIALCAPPDASDARLLDLARASRARVSLPGTRRQLWFQSLRFAQRPLRAAGLHPAQAPPAAPAPPPPDPPLAPSYNWTAAPLAPPGPTTHCAFEPQRAFLYAALVSSRQREPCNLRNVDCCRLARENGAPFFALDDAGCCDLLHVDIATVAHLGFGALLANETDPSWFTPFAGTGDARHVSR